MSSSGSPEAFEIAALKKKATAFWDPMAHGVGTPWEDRATHGVAGAFVKTCVASLTGPRKLAAQIRRPETTGDVRGFVVGCGLAWGLSAAGHLAFGLYRKAHRPDVDVVSVPLCVVYVLLALVGGTVGVVLLWMLYTAIYHRLVSQETRTVTVPEPMLANVAGYAFGPSVLAIIPVFGPALALVGLFASMVGVGLSTRVRLKFATAVIDTVFGFAAIAAIGAGGTYLALKAGDYVLPEAISLVDPKSLEASRPAVH